MPTNLSGLQVAGVPTMGMGGGGIPTTTGQVFFVSSVSGSNGNTGEADNPLATLAYAYSKCRANKGDVVVLMPGHAETYTASTAFATGGVTVVGLGIGAARPTFTLGTANTCTFAVSANQNLFQNILFVANFLSIAACFTLTTATNFTLDTCEFRDTTSVLDFLNIVKSTGAANTVDGLTVSNCLWRSLGTTSMGSLVLTANDIDRLTVFNNTVIQDTTVDAASGVVVSAGVLTNALVSYNKTRRKNTTATAALISVGGTTSSGVVFNNYCQTLDTATNVLYVTTVGLSAFNNFLTGVAGASGFLIPAADS